MRLAVSNIAWPAGADEEAVPLLLAHGVAGVELAPTKLWHRPLEAGAADVARCRDWWERRGLPVVALQALLYGRPDLMLFGTPAAREAAAEYLEGVVRLAAGLGARALVFGSPGNRRRGDLDPAAATAIAVPFFRRVADVAAGLGVWLCVEPNPPAYDCDWVTTAAEAVALVDAVGQEGFGLHLDTAAMHLAGDDPDCVRAAGGRLRHFHVSAPHLHGVPGDGVPYAAFARALHDQRYPGWVSIEMAEAKLCPGWREGLTRALGFVRDTFTPPPSGRSDESVRAWPARWSNRDPG
jgi:sugar phosphate isomerase/epimerase